jgi:hypothetical protein
MAEDAPGMRGERSRNDGGELRRKRSDTHVGSIEDNYDVDFRCRSDMHLETLLKREGVDSLDQLLRNRKGE